MIAALVLGVAGRASAAPELRLSPASGPPGAEFTISGTGFEAAAVELRWGSQSGPPLAEATGPDFSVTAVVPADAPSNSHPVVAVVRDGNTVSTSNASFQVTPGAEPVEPVEPPNTTTTVPVDEPTTTVPAFDIPLPTSDRSVAGPGGRTSGVDGGLDPLMADTLGGTTNGGTPGASSAGAGTGAGATASSTPSPVPTADGSTTTTVGAPAGAGAGADTNAGSAPRLPGRADAEAPGAGRDGPTGTALGRTSTSQSSGAVESPLMLVIGLGMVFAGGVVLAVRNRDRIGRGSPTDLG